MSSRSYIKESLRQYKEQLENQKRKGDRPSGGSPADDTGKFRPPVLPEEPPAVQVKTPSRPTPPPSKAPVELRAAPPQVKAPQVQPAPRVRMPESMDETADHSLDDFSVVAAVDLRAGHSPRGVGIMDRPVIHAPPPTRFRPLEPKTLESTGIDAAFIEDLVIKVLASQPRLTGRQISAMIALHHRPVREVLNELRDKKLVVHHSGTAVGDFKYELSQAGRGLAADIIAHNRYVGPAPVPLDQWLMSVHEQSIANEKPKLRDLQRAFQDLLVPDLLLQQLGPAMTSGKGLFLFGYPGNGKTSLAERMTRAFGTSVYIPYAILVHGTFIKIFDPMVHEPLDEIERSLSHRERIDGRWVKCRRPTVVAGGELTMDSLEIDFDSRTGVCEAPIQMKANCGTLVIDDFGRQRVDPATLLNRWIVPLEQRVDYLRLPDGRKVQVPFDPLLVFSTNLDPKDLCDEAFLRRIPYKVEVVDPSEEDFRRLLHHQCDMLGFEPDDEVFDYLVDEHYRRQDRPFRNCHPRDLILQVQNQCLFRETPLKLTRRAFDEAASLYFTLL